MSTTIDFPIAEWAEVWCDVSIIGIVRAIANCISRRTLQAIGKVKGVGKLSFIMSILFPLQTIIYDYITQGSKFYNQFPVCYMRKVYVQMTSHLPDPDTSEIESVETTTCNRLV